MNRIRLTLSIPTDVHERMKTFTSVNWSATATNAFKRRMDQIDRFRTELDKLAGKFGPPDNTIGETVYWSERTKLEADWASKLGERVTISPVYAYKKDPEQRYTVGFTIE